MGYQSGSASQATNIQSLNIVTMKFVLALPALLALSEASHFLPGARAPFVPAGVRSYAAYNLRGNGFVVAEGIYGPYVRYDTLEPTGYKQYHYGYPYDLGL